MYKSQHFFFITVKWIQLKNCSFTGNFYTHWIYIVLFREWVEYILALNTCHFFFFIFIYKELKFQSYNVLKSHKRILAILSFFILSISDRLEGTVPKFFTFNDSLPSLYHLWRKGYRLLKKQNKQIPNFQRLYILKLINVSYTPIR